MKYMLTTAKCGSYVQLVLRNLFLIQLLETFPHVDSIIKLLLHACTTPQQISNFAFQSTDL